MNSNPLFAFVDDEGGHLPLHDRDGELVGWALVDVADFERLASKRWCRSSTGAVVRNASTPLGRHTIALAREVLGLPAYGPPRIVHANGDLLDCRSSNLRPSRAWVLRALNNMAALSSVERRLAREHRDIAA